MVTLYRPIKNVKRPFLVSKKLDPLGLLFIALLPLTVGMQAVIVLKNVPGKKK